MENSAGAKRSKAAKANEIRNLRGEKVEKTTNEGKRPALKPKNTPTRESMVGIVGYGIV